jgi:hypothetical protein
VRPVRVRPVNVVALLPFCELLAQVDVIGVVKQLRELQLVSERACRPPHLDTGFLESLKQAAEACSNGNLAFR